MANANLVQVASTVIGAAANMYERQQEKERQENLDQYNKELNARNYQAQQIQNSASYQLSQARNAGFNPLAQGMSPGLSSPQAGTPVTGQPMPTEPSGNMISSLGSSLVDGAMKSESLALQQEQLRLGRDQLDFQIKQKEFEIQQAQAEFLVKVHTDGQLSLEHLNEQLSKMGYRFDESSKQLERTNIDIALGKAELGKKQVETDLGKAQLDKTTEETKGVKLDNALKDVELRFQNETYNKRVEQLVNVTTMQSEQIRGQRLNNQSQRIKNCIDDIKRLGVEYLGDYDSLPQQIKARFVSILKHPSSLNLLKGYLYRLAEGNEDAMDEYKKFNQLSLDYDFTEKTLGKNLRYGMESSSMVGDGFNIVARIYQMYEDSLDDEKIEQTTLEDDTNTKTTHSSDKGKGKGKGANTTTTNTTTKNGKKVQTTKKVVKRKGKR